MKEFNCLVCKEKFKDGWYHVLTPLKGILVPKDKAHAEAFQIYADEGDCPFCGNSVVTNSANGESWSTSCSGCEFLFNEG